MMHMYFWWGDDLGDFFIQGFKINTVHSMVLLCLCLFILSIAVEGLKVHRTRSRARAAREKSRSLSCSPSENTILISTDGNRNKKFLPEIFNGIKEVSIFAFHNILNYGLMLAVMMYNGYIFVAVAMGAFIGYFLFGHLSMKINMENLQAIQTKIVCSSRCADSGALCADNSGPCSNDHCNNHF
ncbi:CLUMA_CG011359, isoform C [Clunio marinus]|uniref:Copper transport protein n=1 Tax=Clunio marinus TaxID=568069 RepID=A0A1J1IG27_9DIPT|nr:CLUMA_CG011359, isoform C [Clunio marinus]